MPVVAYTSNHDELQLMFRLLCSSCVALVVRGGRGPPAAAADAAAAVVVVGEVLLRSC